MNLSQLLFYVVLAIVSTTVVWKSSSLLEVASEKLALYYQLPEVVQGAVIAAVGSSFPELSSTVLATLVHGEFELGIAGIVGSAIFNILVIPGVAGLLGGRLAADRLLVYKDAQFYIISVTVLLLAFSFALIYNPVPGAEWEGLMTRPIALMPIAVYGLYIFLHQQDTAEHWAEQGGRNEENLARREINAGKQWLRLLLSLVLIVFSVEGLVRAAIGLGEAFNTPTFLWGLTVIAAGTSLPDMLVSVRAAKKGQGTISLANVLGSNIFDLLVAIPVGVLIAGASPIDFAIAAPMMAVLTFATIVLFAFLRTGLILKKRESVVLLGLYAGFLVWTFLETFGVTSVVL
ncbi:MAG: sodium:calcium antiporter [Leptolyngbyaceae cyanobacterium SL_1_1]|nr:sodium:calcium antiporter [Leptolyngbyaceae cyanobacterium RM1_1_2]NJO08743.1 sodium:calcium antiporter [Leptolyngbyaceae cyanobacterium SL_1_1]